MIQLFSKPTDTTQNSNSTSSIGKSSPKLPSTGGTSAVVVGSIAFLMTAIGVVLRRRKH